MPIRRCGILLFIGLFSVIVSEHAIAEIAEPDIAGPPPNDPYPWAAFGGISTQSTSYPLCSGTVISPTWVLTAAHCGATTSSVFSQTFQGTMVEGGYAILEVIPDPAFTGTSSYDVALLHLAQPFNSSIPFILGDEPLPPVDPTTTLATSVYAEGYGLNDGLNGSPTEGIATIGIFVIAVPPQPITIAPDQIYLDYTANHTRTCEGDEGGPVYIYGTNGFPVVFATIQGNPFVGGCSFPQGTIGIRIDQVLNFIEQHVTDACLASMPTGPHCDGIFRNGNEMPLNSIATPGG